MEGKLLELAGASKRVIDLAYAASMGHLSDIARLHRAMRECDVTAKRYWGEE